MKPVHAKRRVATAACTAIAAVLSQAALAAGTQWKAPIWGPQRTATIGIEWYAKEVAARTGGQVKIDFSYGRAKATDAAEALKSGAADGAYVCAAYFADRMPLATVMDLPMFAPENIATLGRVELALADHPAIEAELAKWNVKMLLPVPLQQYQLMGTRRLAKVEDLQGAKVRVAPEMGKVLAEFGATTSLVAPTEAVAVLRNGSIDLFSMPYPYGFAAFKIQEGSKYVTDKISLGTQLCYFGVNRKAWNALPAKVRESMLGLRAAAVQKYDDAYAREDGANIAAFKQQGLEFVPFNPADRARLVAKAIKYWRIWVDEREKQGLKGREVFEFVQAKMREFDRK
jgi:TRAP-type C4-dicarboxylate transport system substrate-binding protein